jgi:hypothetical protein
MHISYDSNYKSIYKYKKRVVCSGAFACVAEKVRFYRRITEFKLDINTTGG